MAILLKAAAGGVFIACILLLSQTRFGPLAGLLLFFPIISVPTFYFIGSGGNGGELRETILWSLWSVPVWILFAATLYYCSYRFHILVSLSAALAAWFLGAGLIVGLRRFF